MKTEIRLALLCLATASVPAFAQSASPMCGSTNYDQAQNAYTIVNPAARAVNQQCFVTVYPSGAVPDQARQDPNSYLAEGRYIIELVGGGGGGGGGAGEKGNGGEGGGGGAGAVPSRTVQYLSPGVYKLTIGTGGYGGAARGGRTGDGNPTSLTNAQTGQLVAGFAGADVWTKERGIRQRCWRSWRRLAEPAAQVDSPMSLPAAAGERALAPAAPTSRLPESASGSRKQRRAGTYPPDDVRTCAASGGTRPHAYDAGLHPVSRYAVWLR